MASSSDLKLPGYYTVNQRIFRTQKILADFHPIFHDDEKGSKIKQRKKKKEERKAMKNATYYKSREIWI